MYLLETDTLNGTGQCRIFAERTLDAIVDVSGFFAP